MGLPKTSSAPPYDDNSYHHHSSTQFTPSGSSTMYPNDPPNYEPPSETESATLLPRFQPQDSYATPLDLESTTPLQDLAAADGHNHSHCAHCEREQEKRERRMREKHCCNMVAAVFIVLILCIALIAALAITHTRH